jgi:hypothetical protein
VSGKCPALRDASSRQIILDGQAVCVVHHNTADEVDRLPSELEIV